MAGAWREASRMVRPPRELGKVAFSQTQSDKGAPTRSVTACLIAWSKAAVAPMILLGGQERRAKATLGRRDSSEGEQTPSVHPEGQVSELRSPPLF